MSKDDSRALNDMDLQELDIVTTSGAAATDYALVINATTFKPSLMLISELDKLIT